MQTITLELPEAIMHRAAQAADALERPVQEVLVAMLDATLPNVDDVPSEMQADLARMTWLSDHELWIIARSTMPEDQQEQLRYLSELQAQRALSHEEKESLEGLLQAYGRVTLRKAQAYALLSLRSGRALLADI